MSSGASMDTANRQFLNMASFFRVEYGSSFNMEPTKVIPSR